MSSIDGDDHRQVPWDAQSHASGTCEEKIFVAVRLRPLNAKEISSNDLPVWECINNTTIVFKNSLGERSMHPNAYRFDRVFGGECSTKEVYADAAKEVALSVVNGINSSVFAYGQTSSGKTYTMAGITQHTVDDIYGYIDQHPEREFALKFAAMEIYNEAVRDLLSSDSTQLRVLDDPERGTVVEKLSEQIVSDKGHLLQLLSLCEAQRQIGETLLNETSSRSHQILRLTVESSMRQIVGTASTSTFAANVNFVDLAGSERASQTMSAGVRLKEGSHINRSLLTLGTVIRKLSKGRNSHIPYRDSKLTRILQNSLGGNARTAIICTLSPAHSHLEQSRNTLFFGSCAKQVSTNAQVNIVMSDKALVKQLRKELSRMEGELKYISSISVKGDYSALLREKELQIEKMDKEIKELSKQRDIALSQIDKLLESAEHKQSERKQVQSHGLQERRRISVLDSPVVVSDYLRSDIDLKTLEVFNHLNHNHKDGLNDRNPNCWEISENELLSVENLKSTAQKSDQEDSEENCKEVHCIEVEAAKSDKNTEFDRVVLNSKTTETPPRVVEVNPDHSPEEFDALVKRIRELQGAIDSLVSQKEEVENSTGSPESDTSSCAEYSLMRSRSCKAVMMDSPSSPWFDRSQHNTDILVDGFNRKSSSRPFNLPRPPSDLNGLNTNKPSSGNSDYDSVIIAHGSTSSASESINQPDSDEVSLRGSNRIQELRMSKRDDKMLEFKITDESTMVSPTHNSLQDFEQKRKKIIELWDACNTSLVHRSYFFLLFQGDDPSDSVYIEVETRRLSYILSKFSQSGKIRMEDQILTPASSMKALNQERDMLSKQMHKKITPKEREALFIKWGIKLESKKRKVQLARRLWTDNKEMEHIQDSANLVAKLAGLFDEGGQVPKEIFVGPNFSPKTLNRRSYSWRGSFTSRV